LAGDVHGTDRVHWKRCRQFFDRDYYRLFFYSADRDEPPHVHVEREESEAKLWLDTVRLEGSRGFARAELRRRSGETQTSLRRWLQARKTG
jgi:hypothetical protein